MSASGGDLGQRVGRGDTTTDVETARTSLGEALRRYSNGATAAGGSGASGANRQLVTDYFARLSRGS